MFAGEHLPLFSVIILQVKCFPFGLNLSPAMCFLLSTPLNFLDVHLELLYCLVS